MQYQCSRGPTGGGQHTSPEPDHRTGGLVAMFVFFSSRLGIVGSIAVSVVVTLILLVVFRVIR